MSVKASWTIADRRVPRSGMRCGILTEMIRHSLRVSLLHIYRSLLAVSASRNSACVMDRLCDFVFTGLTSD